jgi:hypothetical protein
MKALSSIDNKNGLASAESKNKGKINYANLTPAKLFKLMAEQCLPLSEAAQLTGYHEDYLGQRARLGELKAIKIGRNWITSHQALNNFCKTHFGPYPHRPGKIIRSRRRKK